MRVFSGAGRILAGYHPAVSYAWDPGSLITSIDHGALCTPLDISVHSKLDRFQPIDRSIDIYSIAEYSFDEWHS